jgi:hypothetical protein
MPFLIALLAIPGLIGGIRNSRSLTLKRRLGSLGDPRGRGKAAIDAVLKTRPIQTQAGVDGSTTCIYSAPLYAFSLVYDADDRCLGLASIQDNTRHPLFGLPRRPQPEPEVTKLHSVKPRPVQPGPNVRGAKLPAPPPRPDTKERQRGNDR